MTILRRKFSREQKLEIVKQSMEAGVSMEDLASQYKIHVNSLYKWRREYLSHEALSFPGNGNKVLSVEQQEIEHLKQQLREAELEKDILKKALGIFVTKQEKFAFMKRYSSHFPVDKMSKVLGVSRSGYYKWLKYSFLKEGESELDERIKTAFESSRRRYGSPRISLHLNKQCGNKRVSVATVGRRMQALRLVARSKRKYVNTTDSNHNLKTSPNLLDRQFEVKEVNKVWVSDITYIPTDEGWRYLTVILDLADRAVVGWTLSETMHADCTVIKAFTEAIANRGIRPKSDLMFHSDRGVQYACEEFRSILARYCVRQSMSRKGNCWDNAVAESFFKTIKTEELDRHTPVKAKTLNSLVFRYIEGWYNTQRIHSSLGGKTPWETFFEKYLKLAA